MFEIAQSTIETPGAKICVIGIGGGGGNVIKTMLENQLKGIEFIVANTDKQALDNNLADLKIYLGSSTTKGLGAGADPEVGEKAAIESEDEIKNILVGYDMLFITAGMGGGTGTGAAPIIAKIAKELGILTVGVVTKPFLFEGKKRTNNAEKGISLLKAHVDTLIVIPNQKLLLVANEKTPLLETFRKADSVLLQAVKSISDLINVEGLINLDFADIKTVMQSKGVALMGSGFGSGESRAVDAAQAAIKSPLLENISIDGATGVIINITGNSNLTLWEVNEAASLISNAADENAEIIFGSVIDEKIKDNEILVTVVATGFKDKESYLTDIYEHSENKIGQEVSKIQSLVTKATTVFTDKDLTKKTEFAKQTSNLNKENTNLESKTKEAAGSRESLLEKAQSFNSNTATQAIVDKNQLSMNLDEEAENNPIDGVKDIAKKIVKSPFKSSLDWASFKKKWMDLDK